jgi:isopentenyl-diphosphate delta-isomerase
MKSKKIQVVLVDKNDKVLGLKEKFDTHKIPVELHRAISIVLFSKDKSQILLTKRSSKKFTWPHFWTNAVCSHPYPGESYKTAATRRLKEELGISTSLKEVGRFVYKADMDNGIWGEHEYDAVFVGSYEGDIRPNSDEVAGYEWIKITDFKKDLRNNPSKYSPWFKIIVKKLKI